MRLDRGVVFVACLVCSAPTFCGVNRCCALAGFVFACGFVCWSYSCGVFVLRCLRLGLVVLFMCCYFVDASLGYLS